MSFDFIFHNYKKDLVLVDILEPRTQAVIVYWIIYLFKSLLTSSLFTRSVWIQQKYLLLN